MEVQEDTSCRGLGDVPQMSLSSPKSGGQGVESGLSDHLFRVTPGEAG